MCRVFIFSLLVASILAPCVGLATEMTTTRSVAILDFENADKTTSDDDWLCAGMAETLITKLRGIRDLRLVERKQILKAMEELNFSATDFFDSAKSAELAKFLKVDVLLVGGFQHYGESIRITARFVDVATGEVLEAVDIKGEMDEIFDLQDQLALKLIESMGVETSRKERRTIVKKSTTSLSALELYSKALEAETPEEQIALFRQAIEVDPEYKEAYNDLAVVYMDQDDYASAIELLTKAVEIDSTYFLPYFNLGVCYDQLGDRARSIESFQHAIEYNDAYLGSHLALTEAYIADGQYRRALESARKVTEIDPADARGYNLWGNALFSLERYKEAIAQYEQVLELDAEAAYAYYNIANTHVELGENDQALAFYARALEIDPDYALAYYRRAWLYQYRLGDTSKAAVDYATYIEYAPDDPDGYTGLARTYTALGKTSDAKEAFETAIQLNKDDPNTLNDLANILYDEGHIDRAEQLYLDALRADPNYIYAYHNLGRLCAYARGDQESAADYFTKALELNRDYTPSLLEIALVELRRENWDAMISYLMRGRALDPEEALWYYYLGYAYDEKAQISRAEGKTSIANRYATTAEKHLNKAAKLTPDDPDIYNLIGNLRLAKGAPAEAITFYERALEKNDQHVYATVNIATCKRQLGKYDEAEQYFKRTIELSPDYAFAIYQLAAMYDQDMQRFDEAVTFYQRYLEVVGEDEEVASRIEEIEEFGQ